MEEDDYYLKWEKHHNAFISVFDYLYKHEILVDCSLAAEDKYIKVHRIVLMACSPYLQKVLCDNLEKYPVVFFDIKYSILEAIVHFCYRGEVKVAENMLDDFLEAATALKIKGLCKDINETVISDDICDTNKRRLSVSGVSELCANDDNNSVVSNKKRKLSNDESNNRIINDDIIELNPENDKNAANNGYRPGNAAGKDTRNGFASHPIPVVKTEPDDSLARETQGSDDDNSDVDSDDSGDESGGNGGDDMDAINDLLSNSSTILFPWTCNRCGEAFPTRAPYEEHRRNCARSDPISHPWKCHKCSNAYKNKKDLVRHLYYCGNDTPRLYCNRCGNSYKYERGLRRHQKYCGTDVKPLKCPQCEKTYKYKRGLRRHQRRCGIAEALQFLAGKGVTPVVVTKRSLGLPYLGDISRAGLPFTSASQLSQLSFERGVRKTLDNSTDPSAGVQQQTLDPSIFNPALLTEPSVCQCGKVYKYKKSYDKHVATCSCNPNRKTKRGRRSKKRNSTNDHGNDTDEAEGEEEEEDGDGDDEEEEAEVDERGSKMKQNGHHIDEDEDEEEDHQQQRQQEEEEQQQHDIDEDEETYILEVAEKGDEEDIDDENAMNADKENSKENQIEKEIINLDEEN